MNKLVKKYPVLGSSQNPEELSLTVKSIGLALIPLFVAIGKGFDIELVEADLVEVISGLAGLVSIVGVIYGVIRKYK